MHNFLTVCTLWIFFLAGVKLHIIGLFNVCLCFFLQQQPRRFVNCLYFFLRKANRGGNWLKRIAVNALAFVSPALFSARARERGPPGNSPSLRPLTVEGLVNRSPPPLLLLLLL